MLSLVIDSFEFSRQKDRREGQVPVADLSRFQADAADNSGIISWVLQGDSDKFGHPMLRLSVSGSVQLVCQRCLKPFAFDIDAKSQLILAKDEAAIDAIEDVIEDDSVDVIVGSKELNLSELIEDEALLSIPLSPKHDTCSEQESMDVLKSLTKTSPFAVLKDMKSD